MCSIERWSVRTLRERIASQLYLRTNISKKPESIVDSELQTLRSTGQMTPDMVFRDPYMLDFLGLPEHYSECDLETRILADMERFLLELLVFLPFDLDPLDFFISVFFTFGKGITTPFIILLVPILGFVKYVKRESPTNFFMAISFIILLEVYLYY
jgi:hypothetical protein